MSCVWFAFVFCSVCGYICLYISASNNWCFYQFFIYCVRLDMGRAHIARRRYLNGLSLSLCCHRWFAGIPFVQSTFFLRFERLLGNSWWVEKACLAASSNWVKNFIRIWTLDGSKLWSNSLLYLLSTCFYPWLWSWFSLSCSPFCSTWPGPGLSTVAPSLEIVYWHLVFQTLNAISTEQSSTIVFPFPINTLSLSMGLDTEKRKTD